MFRKSILAVQISQRAESRRWARASIFTRNFRASGPDDLSEATGMQKRELFAVRLKLSDEDMALLPGGASGSAVVCTHTLRPLSVIQKMGIRMESYTNYLIGF